MIWIVFVHAGLASAWLAALLQLGIYASVLRARPTDVPLEGELRPSKRAIDAAINAIRARYRIQAAVTVIVLVLLSTALLLLGLDPIQGYALAWGSSIAILLLPCMAGIHLLAAWVAGLLQNRNTGN